MPYFETVLALVLLTLGIRTLSWHLQCWQLREYRLDRMRAWLHTKDGAQYFMPWFFKGLLPRPKLSGRVILITLLTLISSISVFFLSLVLIEAVIPDWCHADLSACPQYGFIAQWGVLLSLFLGERTLWFCTALAVLVSDIPVKLKKQHLFHQAGKIIRQGNPNITRIGITGSYGKSSTKELLVHLLQSEFGKDAVLYNPANENTEVAIARLILAHQKFFKKTEKPQFLVIETGAYRKGEIATVTKMIQPQYAILTGLNQQHVELFGSIERTRDAKFELAEGTSKTVFFNGDNAYLKAIFKDRKITANHVPISFQAAQNLKSSTHKTQFEIYGEKFTLPWPGEFFVHNALLALELCRELGLSPSTLAKHLNMLPPLKRALSLTTHPQGFTLLRDTYSANPDGVLSAIEHLKNFPGKRIFVSIPLRELGGHAESVHQQIFEALHAIKAEVYWEKTDFAELGKKVLGKNFHLLEGDINTFKMRIKTLKKEDVVLLESKLSKKITNLFK